MPLGGGAWAGLPGRFLAEYDWTVAESPDGLRLDHGLLDRRHATVPPGRVQAVRIVEPLLWRRRGWVRVELSVVGAAAAGKDTGGLLLPIATRPDAAQRCWPVCCPASTWPARSPPPSRPRSAPAGRRRCCVAASGTA